MPTLARFNNTFARRVYGFFGSERSQVVLALFQIIFGSRAAPRRDFELTLRIRVGWVAGGIGLINKNAAHICGGMSEPVLAGGRSVL